MPSRSTVQRWRSDDAAFDRMFRWSQEDGYDLLAHRVIDCCRHEAALCELASALAPRPG